MKKKTYPIILTAKCFRCELVIILAREREGEGGATLSFSVCFSLLWLTPRKKANLRANDVVITSYRRHV